MLPASVPQIGNILSGAFTQGSIKHLAGHPHLETIEDKTKKLQEHKRFSYLDKDYLHTTLIKPTLISQLPKKERKELIRVLYLFGIVFTHKRDDYYLQDISENDLPNEILTQLEILRHQDLSYAELVTRFPILKDYNQCEECKRFSHKRFRFSIMDYDCARGSNLMPLIVIKDPKVEKTKLVFFTSLSNATYSKTIKLCRYCAALAPQPSTWNFIKNRKGPGFVVKPGVYKEPSFIHFSRGRSDWILTNHPITEKEESFKAIFPKSYHLINVFQFMLSEGQIPSDPFIHDKKFSRWFIYQSLCNRVYFKVLQDRQLEIASNVEWKDLHFKIEKSDYTTANNNVYSDLEKSIEIYGKLAIENQAMYIPSIQIKHQDPIYKDFKPNKAFDEMIQKHSKHLQTIIDDKILASIVDKRSYECKEFHEDIQRISGNLCHQGMIIMRDRERNRQETALLDSDRQIVEMYNNQIHKSIQCILDQIRNKIGLEIFGSKKYERISMFMIGLRVKILTTFGREFPDKDIIRITCVPEIAEARPVFP